MTSNNQMNQFIHQQFQLLPELLAEPLPDLSFVKDTALPIVFVGSGSSLNAAGMADEYVKRYTARKVSYLSPNEYKKNQIGLEEHLLVAISQTGSSLATLECIQLAKANGYYAILISATQDRQKRSLADTFIDLCCPEEQIGPKTVGFTATFVRLIQLALALGQVSRLVSKEQIQQAIYSLEGAVQAMPSVLQNTKEWLGRHQNWATLPYVTVTAENRFQALVAEGALKLLETLRVPAIAYEIGEFTHGPHRLIKENSYHILVGTGESKELTVDVVTYAQRFTKNTLFISLEKSDIDLVMSDADLGIELLLTLVFQVLSNELALLTGFNPDEKVHRDFFKFVGTKD